MFIVTECYLDKCKDGKSGVISKVIGDCQTTARLQELGFVPGGWFRVIRMGNPAIIQIGDSRFCLRKEQIHGIVVVPHDTLSESTLDDDQIPEMRVVET